MTQKVHGAAYPGIWVERQVAFVKLTFNKDISALAAGDLTLLGTSTAVTGTVAAASVFDIVESALVQALKTVETRATVLAISKYDTASKSVDVMLGTSEGWFSDAAGLVANDVNVVGAQARVSSASGSNATVGSLVSVKDSTTAVPVVTFDVSFAYMNGTMPIATEANGALALGPGSTSGATPTNSPTGTAGFYPA